MPVSSKRKPKKQKPKKATPKAVKVAISPYHAEKQRVLEASIKRMRKG